MAQATHWMIWYGSVTDVTRLAFGDWLLAFGFWQIANCVTSGVSKNENLHLQINNQMILEIACDSIQSALYAEAGGASRIELCDNLAQGGITPSAGKIKLAKQLLDIPVFVLIRPRKGDFLYTDLEFQVMLENIALAKQAGADGIVSGVLLSDGRLDMARMEILINASSDLHFTCHRAFDMCSDSDVALEQLIDLGVESVLTSGQAANVLTGKKELSRLVNKAAGRIEIMAGGGLRSHNIEEIVETGVQAFHSSAKQKIQSQMQFRGHTPMGGESVQEEFEWTEVSADTVKQLKQVLDSLMKL